VGHRGQQVGEIAVAVFGSPQRFAVQCELGRSSALLPGRSWLGIVAFGVLEQPGPDRGIGLSGIDLGYHAPYR
jgi:hypothetical protein